MSVAVANVKVEFSPSASPRRKESSDGNDGNMETKPSKEEPKDAATLMVTKSKVDLNGTPRTEASSPDSRDDATTLDVEDDDFIVAIKQQDSIETVDANNSNNTNSNSKEVSGLGDDDDDNEMPMSQTDQHIHQLDRDGKLNEVAGSQSMLSQELMYDFQGRGRGLSGSADDDEDGSDGNGKESLDDLGSLHLSQETETSVGMAKRIGLLSMTQESEEEAKPAASSTTGTTVAAKDTELEEGPRTPKRTVNRQSMLSRLSNTGAPDLASFSAKKAVIANENRPMVDIADTPVRESEGFGSLLDAVAKITEQEVAEEREDAMLWRKSSYLIHHTEKEIGDKLTPPRRKRSSAPRQASLSPTRTSPRKPVLSKRKIPIAASAAATTSTVKRRKTSLPTTITTTTKKARVVTVEKKKPPPKKNVDDTEEAQAAAIRAAALAERIVTDPGLAKQLLLSMALVRENPRSAPDKLPGPGHVLPDGFVWARYPPLENVLKRHMAEYYQLSTEKCQSAQQQAFNNDMVVVVREVAEELDWVFARCFDDRNLRDRIRCYYKTHIQNAKKRLRTMVRNPTKRANAKHLLQHLDIIENAKVDAEKAKKQKK